MSLAAPTQPVKPSTHAKTRDPLDLLAETIADSSRPVWIHDSAGSCIYRNDMAGDFEPNVHRLAFDLFDHAGCLVGRLITVAV